MTFVFVQCSLPKPQMLKFLFTLFTRLKLIWTKILLHKLFCFTFSSCLICLSMLASLLGNAFTSNTKIMSNIFLIRCNVLVMLEIPCSTFGDWWHIDMRPHECPLQFSYCWYSFLTLLYLDLIGVMIIQWNLPEVVLSFVDIDTFPCDEKDML